MIPDAHFNKRLPGCGGRIRKRDAKGIATRVKGDPTKGRVAILIRSTRTARYVDRHGCGKVIRVRSRLMAACEESECEKRGAETGGVVEMRVLTSLTETQDVKTQDSRLESLLGLRGGKRGFICGSGTQSDALGWDAGPLWG